VLNVKHISAFFAKNIPPKTMKGEQGMEKEKHQEKQPIPWETTDPKPPVIHSGHMENKRQY
jgi:hypothetical protein